METQSKLFTEVKVDYEHEGLRHIDAYYEEDETEGEGVCVGTVHEETKVFTLGQYAQPSMVFDPLVLEALKELGAKF